MKIFHHNDMDGYASASLVQIYYKNSRKIVDADIMKDIRESCIPIDYNPNSVDLFQTVTEGEEVWIVDYSIQESTVSILKHLIDEMHCDVTWIDHHKTTLEFMKTMDYKYLYKEIKGFRSGDHSGAYLTWQYLSHIDRGHFFETVPEYIELISDYDTWSMKFSPKQDIFKLGYDTYPLNKKFDVLNSLYTDFLYNYPSAKFDSYLDKIIDRGKLVYDYNTALNEGIRKVTMYRTEFMGYKAVVVNAFNNSWVFGNLIKYPNVDICILWHYDGDYYHASIYSDQTKENPVDCSEICKKFGGGGHAGAAGFVSKEFVFPKIEGK
jgi:hypothetical protein